MSLEILHLHLLNNFGMQLAFTGLTTRSVLIMYTCITFFVFPHRPDLHRTAFFLLHLLQALQLLSV
jgi:hypothetical protein